MVVWIRDDIERNHSRLRELSMLWPFVTSHAVQFRITLGSFHVKSQGKLHSMPRPLKFGWNLAQVLHPMNDRHSQVSRSLDFGDLGGRLGRSLTRAPTGADIRPFRLFMNSRKPRRVAPQNFACLFIYQFCVLCVKIGLLTFKVLSPGHLEWPDVKSLYCIFIAVSEPQFMTKHFETRRIV